MALALSIVGVAFTAICVWLTVRIVNRREWWVKWTLAGVGAVPVLYFASFGPICRLVSREILPTATLEWAYRPFILPSVRIPGSQAEELLQDAFFRWAELWDGKEAIYAAEWSVITGESDAEPDDESRHIPP